jgi:anthranilate phosphoribosyltransferase
MSKEPVKEANQLLAQGQSLPEQLMSDAMDSILLGNCSDSQIKALLIGLHTKGETVAELTGAAKAMRKHMRPIHTNRENVVDTCGTGGGKTGTFNISTAAAIVAASAGASVAKHGNRKSTSQSGSADVLVALGVNVECSVDVAEKCLNQLGLCFCFAPMFHPSIKHVMGVRRSLPHPTIFNLLGPLCNPARAPFQVLGAGRAETRRILAEALAQLGTTRSIVVHSRDGLGEISVGDVTDISEVMGRRVTEGQLSAREFGLAPARNLLIQAVDPADSADKIRRVLEGQEGSARDMVIVNAAAALWVSDLTDSPAHGAERCATAIDNGQAKEMLKELVWMTNRK